MTTKSVDTDHWLNVISFCMHYLNTYVLVGHYIELPVNIKGVLGTKCLTIVCFGCGSSSAYHTLLSKMKS